MYLLQTCAFNTVISTNCLISSKLFWANDGCFVPTAITENMDFQEFLTLKG